MLSLPTYFKTKISLVIYLLTVTYTFAQNATISGFVKGEEGTILSGAIVHIKGNRTGIFTTENGFYRLGVEPGSHTLIASYAGFAPFEKEVTVGENEALELNFELTSTTLDEMVVLGLRKKPRSQLDSPVPVDVIDIKSVTNDVGQVNLNQLLNYVAPSFNSNTQTMGDGTDHIDPASLRGLGPDQVLVLINGKRRHTTSLININSTFGKGTVGTDLNAIPTSSIKRIEILRDGAAAQYGSDAIAGVINIILEDEVNKLRINTTGSGYTSRNSEGGIDGQTFQLGTNYGIQLGQRGFINLAGSIDFRNPTNRMKEFTGVIFTDYNNPILYSQPTGKDITEEELQRRGLTRSDFNSRIGQAATAGGAVSFNSSFFINPQTEVYSFGGINYRKGQSASYRRVPAQLSQNSVAVRPMGYLPFIETDNTDHWLSTGIRGKLGNWNTDLSNTFGRNQVDFTTSNTVNASLQSLSPTQFSNGGYRFSQNTVNLDLTRDFPNYLKGVTLALGAEYRYENYKIKEGEEKSYEDYGPIIKAPDGSNYIGGSQAFPGFRPQNVVDVSRNSSALYSELIINPSHKWLIDGAMRFEHYSDFGNTLNWKLSSRYKLGESITVRASASTGFRAPSLHQRYFSATSTSLSLSTGKMTDVGTFTNESQLAQWLGIPSLKHETSVSYGGGITGRLGNIRITADGYYVRINNRVILTGQFLGNASDSASYQDRVIANLLKEANAQTARFFANAIDTKTYGADLVVSHVGQVGKGKIKTELSATFSRTSVTGAVKGKRSYLL